jgi:hypothetical protein
MHGTDVKSARVYHDDSSHRLDGCVAYLAVNGLEYMPDLGAGHHARSSLQCRRCMHHLCNRI